MRGTCLPICLNPPSRCTSPSQPGTTSLLPPPSLAQEFVSGIDGIPPAAQAELLALTPATYIGNAAQQAKDIRARLAAL